MTLAPDQELFADTLGRILAETYTSIRRLSGLSGVSRRTLENWLHGNVARPRYWEPVLRVATALHLPAAETDLLLQSAGLPSLATLLAGDHSAEQSDLLAVWSEPGAQVVGTAAPEMPRHNLPAPTTPFIGRRKQLERLLSLMQRDAARLITVTGAGGIGKTRLALEAARQAADWYAHGVVFVPLESVNGPEEFYERLLTSLRAQQPVDRPASETVLDCVRDRQMLLLLDTFEYVLDAAGFLGEMLRVAPELQILVTSRAVLHVSGENVFAVPLLNLPDPAGGLQAAATSEAVTLFEARVQEVRPDFVASAENLPDIVAICTQLAGLPLAIELAAARTRMFSLAELRAQLGESMAVLSGGPRDAPARQRSIGDTLAWSYDLLGEDEQTVLRRLSIFSNGVSLATAQAVAPGWMQAGEPFINAFSALIDHSLVETRRTANRQDYQLHDLTREFAAARLAAGERDAAMARLLDHLGKLAAATDRHFRDGERDYWLAKLDPEAQHVWPVLEWGVAQDDVAVLNCCLRMTGDLLQYWNLRGLSVPGREWTQRALAAAERLPVDPVQQARAGCTAAALALIQADAVAALGHADSALAVAEAAGDRRGIVHALHLLGLANFGLRDLERTAAIWNRGLVMAEALGDGSLIARALDDLGNLADLRGDYEEALALHTREAEVSRAVRDRYSEFYAVINLSGVSRRLGRMEEAEYYARQALDLSRAMGDPRSHTHTLVMFARLLLTLDKPDEAQTTLIEALDIGRRTENLDIVTTAIELLLFASDQGMTPATRIRLMSIVYHHRQTYPSLPEDAEALADLIERMRRSVGEQAFVAEWQQGKALNWAAAVDLALEEVSGEGPPSSSHHQANS